MLSKEEKHKQDLELMKNWRSWGSWFSWGSPIGLGIFLLCLAGTIWILAQLA